MEVPRHDRDGRPPPASAGRRPAADRALRLPARPAALYAACIPLWYEQCKPTGDEGSVYLFTTLTDRLGAHGREEWMRIGVCIAETAASALILPPATRGLGASGVLAPMSGAIFLHTASPLGVAPYGDGGVLSKEACPVWLCGLSVAAAHRDDLLRLAWRLRGPLPRRPAASA